MAGATARPEGLTLVQDPVCPNGISSKDISGLYFPAKRDSQFAKKCKNDG